MTEALATGNVPFDRYYLDSFVIQSMSGAQTRADPRGGLETSGTSATTDPTTLDNAQTGDQGQMRGIIHSWSITESIKTGSVRGKAKVYDSVGLFYTLPIKGQERIYVKYRDFEGIVREDYYMVYAVTDVKPSSDQDDSMIEYMLHFTSMGKFVSDRFRVRRCINNGPRNYIPISDQVNVIYEDYYNDPRSGLINDKDIVVTDTNSPAQIVIPNMTPEEAMHLFSRKAYSPDDPAQAFRFFENRDAFYFTTIKDLVEVSQNRNANDPRNLGNTSSVDTPPRRTFYYSSDNANLGDRSEEDYLRRRENVVSMSYGDVNTMEAIKKGAYYHRVTEADVINRIVEDYDYEYYDEYSEYTYPDGQGRSTPNHDLPFVNRHMNYPVTDYVLRDFSQNGGSGFRPYPYYRDILNNKKAYNFHHGQNGLSITINGYNDIVAGSIIHLDVPTFMTGVNDPDALRSGYYLVESVTNDFYETQYKQNLRLTKGGFLE